MSQQKPILDYASPPPIVLKLPTPIHLIVLLFILPALALPFVEHFMATPLSLAGHFFMGIFEARDYRGKLGLTVMVGLNFFVGIPLVLCHLRVLIFGELSKIETWGGYVIAALAMASAIALCIDYSIVLLTNEGLRMLEGMRFIPMAIVPNIVLALGLFAVWFLGKHISHGTRICACLCIPYAAGLLSWMAYIVGNNPEYFITPKHWRFELPMLSFPVMVGVVIELTTLTVMAFQRRQTELQS